MVEREEEEISQDKTSEVETLLEAIGITHLPIFNNRRKQNFLDLLIDDNLVDFGSSSEDLLLLEDEENDTSEMTVAEPVVENTRNFLALHHERWQKFRRKSQRTKK